MAQYLVFTVKRKYDSIMYLLSATKFTVCPICQYALFLSAQSQKEPTSLSTKKLASPALHVIPPDPSLRQRLRGWDCETPSPEPEMRHTKPFKRHAPPALPRNSTAPPRNPTAMSVRGRCPAHSAHPPPPGLDRGPRR